jgi:hypothetical protein
MQYLIPVLCLCALMLAGCGTSVNGDSNVPLSAASKRFKVDDSRNEFFTLFRYKPAKGLGYEKGVNRRDPSTIIKVDDLYYVWYTRTAGDPDKSIAVGPERATETLRAFRWDLAEIWYATSPDGVNWTEQGLAIPRGPKGEYDDRSVFTTNVLVTDDKYFLVYQAVKAPYGHRTNNVIGMSWAGSPDGPWHRLPKPILKTDDSGVWKENYEHWSEVEEDGAWDSHKVHDPGILVRDGKYWLYYKGQQIGRLPWESKWGVAIADKPEGPYVKHPLNPITNSGHEIWVWPWKSGVAAMIDWAGPEKNTIQYAEDGVNFEIVAALADIPPAGGAYIPDKFTNTKDGQGFTWGVSYIRSDWDYLVRFECDLQRNKPKDFTRIYSNYGHVLGWKDQRR